MKTDGAKSQGKLAPAIGLAGVAALLAYGAWAQVQLEPGRWTLRVSSTTNGKPDPVQNSEQCLGDELKDLGSYFAPQLQGAEADCKRSEETTAGKIVRRMECTGDGFSVAATTTVTIIDSRRFTASIQVESKTPKQTSSVVADAEGRWTGACKAK
jgi:Protein of unknown function (DUF3617)